MDQTPSDSELSVKQQAERLHDVCLDWAVYFSMLARLFGQTAIGFTALAKFPVAEPESMRKAYQIMRSVDRDCGAFRDGMASVGPDMDRVMRELAEDVSAQAKKSEDQPAPSEDSKN